MGIFEKIFTKKEDLKVANSYFKALTAYQPVFTSWNGKLYESERVRSAIDARARHISKLNITAEGPLSKAMEKCFKVRPNSFMTWSQFLYRLDTILDMQNSAFILPILDPLTNQMIGLYPALPSRTEVVEDATGHAWLKYTFSNGNTGAIEYERCGILTKFQYNDDFFGDDNGALANTMDLMTIQQQAIKVAVKNSATYRFMARVTNFTKPEDLKKEREKFSEKNLKSDSEGGVLLFPNTYSDIQQLKNAPYTVDAEQARAIDTNVFNYFGVNTDIIQNKAIGDQINAFFEGAIAPFAIQFSEVVTQMCFTEAQILAGAKVKAQSNRMLYLSAKDRLNVSKELSAIGAMSRNEVRAVWDLDPIEGGDVYTVRGEYYFFDENGNIITKDDSEEDKKNE